MVSIGARIWRMDKQSEISECGSNYGSPKYVMFNIYRWIATTQMEPVHARKVFPSFDEPRFKATFDVTINRPASFEPSISNTKIQTNTT